MEAIHVGVWTVEQVQRGMRLDNALVVLWAVDYPKRNGRDVFCKGSDASIDPGGLVKGVR